MTRDELWYRNFELLKAYVAEHHHLPDKKKVEDRGLLNWAKFQRRKIKAGDLDEEKARFAYVRKKLREFMVYLEVKNFDSTFAILPMDCGDAVLLPRTKLDAAISGIFSVKKVSCR